MKDSERSGGRPGASTWDRNPQRVFNAFWAQLASIYVLAGLLAVALIGAFALAAGLVVLHRGSVNLVERQLDMLASAAGASVAWALETMPLDSRGDLSEANAARLAGQLSRRLPGATAMITRTTEAGGTESVSSPSGAPDFWPQWLSEAGFRGIVQDGGRLHVRATATSSDSRRPIRILFSVPLDEGLARLISNATGLSVKLEPGRGEIAAGRSRSEALLRRLNGLIESGGGPGEGGWMPVVAVARKWKTGNLEEHRALAVKPDLRTMSRQLAQFGRGQAAWVFVLSGLSAGFLLMQTAGVAFAVRMGRRMVLSINDLTAGAARVGSGDLAHRVPVRHRDQIGRFVTIFWAEYDPITRMLRYANAGHNAPLYLKPGGSQPVRLSASGPPVGLFADAFYDDETITLAPGSALIAFTDGLTEAYATNGEEFGEARLIDVCRRSSGLPAGRLIDAVWTAHEEWTAGVDRADDATMVVLQVLKRQQAAVLWSAFLLEGGAPADAALQEV